jgi:hypothetical protein
MYVISLTPPPAAVFSWFQVDKSRLSNSSLKIRSPLQMVAGALVPMAVVGDERQSAEAAAIVQTNITRDLMVLPLRLAMFSIGCTARCLLFITSPFCS